MPRGKFTNHKGRNRKFTIPEELEEQRKQEEQKQKWRKENNIESTSEESEEEKSGSGSEESDSDDDKPVKAKGVSGLIEVENPNRVAKKNKKLNNLQDLGEGEKPQLSRREREEIERQRAAAAYQKAHAEGKTDQARADLARLAIIRQQREKAAKRREAEKKAKEDTSKRVKEIYTSHKGRHRKFNSPEEIEKQRQQVEQKQKWRKDNKIESTSEQSENEKSLSQIKESDSDDDLLSLEMDRQETEKRRKILLLHGVAEKSNEVALTSAINVFTGKMKLTNFGSYNIDDCHRLGNNRGKVRPILVQFRYMEHRQEVWSNKSSLKNTGIIITEFLTKTRRQVYTAAREYFGNRNCWTAEGMIVIRAPEKKCYKIETSAELDTLMAKFKKLVKPKGVSGLIKFENPNRVGEKKKKLNNLQDLGEGERPEQSREEIESQDAHDEDALADLARLAIIRQQREEAAKRREAEKSRRREEAAKRLEADKKAKEETPKTVKDR